MVHMVEHVRAHDEAAYNLARKLLVVAPDARRSPDRVPVSAFRREARHVPRLVDKLSRDAEKAAGVQAVLYCDGLQALPEPLFRDNAAEIEYNGPYHHNPLRPRGALLAPYTDNIRPVAPPGLIC